ncbi:MAG TPA: tyrosine-protein phosphatase, partial [Schnuerera sp.]
VQDLQLLSDIFDIKTIISLDGEIGNNIHSTVEDLGMKHIILPLRGNDTPNALNFFSNNIHRMMDKFQPVYIHCRHGSDRTGMAAALYRIRQQGWSPTKALIEAYYFDFGDKLDDETFNLYSQIITDNAEDVNDSLDSTIVSRMQNWFNQGLNPPAFSPQQSFAPPENIPMSGLDGNAPYVGLHSEESPPLSMTDPMMPAQYLDPYPSDSQSRKRELARLYLDQLPTQIPLSGHYDVAPYGIRGVGPVEPQYFLTI